MHFSFRRDAAYNVLFTLQVCLLFLFIVNRSYILYNSPSTLIFLRECGSFQRDCEVCQSKNELDALLATIYYSIRNKTITIKKFHPERYSPFNIIDQPRYFLQTSSNRGINWRNPRASGEK